MTLKEKIFNDFQEAFKSRNELKKSVLSMILAEIKNKEIVLLSREAGLNDEQVVTLLRKAIKQREESAQVYRQGGRIKLAEREEEEKEILTAYLPQEVDDSVIEKIVAEVKVAIGAQSPADLGKMMKEVMARLKGQADGKRVNQAVQRALNESR
mgnify:CR=1 FL=1